MKNSYILMIDDDIALVGIMAIKLRQIGYNVDTATQSNLGFSMARKKQYDAIILDVTMPGFNGFEVCQKLRACGVLVPILMLSGMADKPNIVHGLDAGADDYMTKPFSHNELDARLQALIRRTRRAYNSCTVSCSGVLLDIAESRVSYEDKSVFLTKKESLLLRKLIDETPTVITREKLLKDVWGINDMYASNRLDVYIRRLRIKMRTIGAEHCIRTLRGSGYYFRGNNS
jgi:DNA-binding response OmpR family regulator